ncbi:MAG: FKBP-type peptidyl-prolyl cis-trans isomerase [Bacteroidales bacterium]|jgi:FKBP-type peptidyl-prolyl cis-trans isomerase|nr:FKBP-type peptidyl-prolyl cis-trans isomerase [Bacteroidales bacterium]MBQ5603262.1 FKBP-type peptidyl-prolyl cis-trans isomerase [Bacteroidales bacterium]
MKLRNLALVFMCIASVSCVKQKLESTYNSQENRIDQYIEKNRISGTDTLRVVYNGGASRLVTKEGNGPELSADGNIAFYYAGYTFSGSISNSNLFSTNHQQTATQAGWTLSEEDAKALSINMNDYKLLPGLKSGLTGVKGGEECQILFTGKYGFGNKAFGIIPANSALVYKIWVESISND